MFLSRRYRPSIYPFYGLVALESGLTVALLAFTGIAAPNTYRNKLWLDGANNGFNSNPNAALYAAANYRPYTTPRVWGQFITNYNLVVVVLSMFLLLVKSTLYMLHVFPPIVSAVLHVALLCLYAVSIAYQASPDNSDPQHPSNGPVWYITKPCSVAYSKSNIGYCQQAKATFACFCTVLGLFAIYAILSVWSCCPSKQQLEEYRERQRERREKKQRWAEIDALEKEQNKVPQSAAYSVPDTPGWQQGMSPATPRTIAFNPQPMQHDLPLRSHLVSPVKAQATSYALRSPGINRTPMTLGPQQDQGYSQEQPGYASSAQPTMFFPPPPKQSTKR